MIIIIIIILIVCAAGLAISAVIETDKYNDTLLDENNELNEKLNKCIDTLEYIQAVNRTVPLPLRQIYDKVSENMINKTLESIKWKYN